MKAELLVAYAAPLAAILAAYLGRQKLVEKRSLKVKTEEYESGRSEPSSLHPIIDPAKCLGCGACVVACPEGDVLGLVNGKAELIAPAQCIGHGACKAACPRDAISLVFGTEKRGVDIPHVDPDFQTNVPGIFIAGELGGMGLIRNAIEQGRQAMGSIGALNGLGRQDRLDVVIVGAGPAGISASLSAIEQGLSYATLEQDSFGGTVAHFPRGKVVMTQPANLPIVGKVTFGEIAKEELLAFWERVASDTGLCVRYGERVETILPQHDGFIVRTQHFDYPTRAVLLSIGRRGTPRTLDVPGEEMSKVVYRLVDPEQYRGQHVLVVGGGDSALEAATSLAEEPGTTVTLSYRSDGFGRAKSKNRQRVERCAAEGRLTVMLKSSVQEIRQDSVVLESEGRALPLANDAVIVCAGGILPTGFLKGLGVDIETKYGTA